MAPRRSRGPRRYGVGTYDQITDGRHRWRYTTTLAGGQTKRIDIKARELADLDRKVEAFLDQERRFGHALDVENRTVREWCESWLEDRVRIRNEASTVIKYRTDLNRILPYIGAVRVRALEAAHVQTAIAAMTDLKTKNGQPRYSPTTIARSVHTLRNAFNVLVLTGKLASNPVNLKDRHVDLPKGEEYEPVILNAEQLAQLLETARGTWIECALHVYALTGMRRGEVLGLHRTDLDFKTKRITPRHNVKYVGTKVVIGNLKTKASKKAIPMTDELAAWLKEQERRVAAMRDARPRYWTEQGLVFPATNGKPMHPRNLQRAFKQLLAKADLPRDFTIHGIRHSYGTLLGQKYNAKVLQDLLRHADVRTTYRYVHSDESQARAAADDIAETLGTKRRKIG